MWPDSTINVGVIWSRKTKKKPIYDHDVKEIFGVAISVEKFFAWSKRLFFFMKIKALLMIFCKVNEQKKKNLFINHKFIIWIFQCRRSRQIYIVNHQLSSLRIELAKGIKDVCSVSQVQAGKHPT